jgi:hypothetical protein
MTINPGVFTMKTAQDLLQKLECDFKALRASPTDSYICFNFFVTAEHLPEWHLQANAKAAKQLRLKHALLRVCSHIANGAKHFVVQDERHYSVDSTHVATAVSFDRSTGQQRLIDDAAVQKEFFIRCDPTAAKELGEFISVTELAGRLLQFWRHKLNS